MRARLGFLPALALLLAAALMAPASVLAATSEQVAAEAQTTWKQTCVVNTGNRTCTGPSSRIHQWTAVVLPASGPVVRLRTDAVMFGAPPMDVASRDWMIALHSLVCGDPKGVTAFVNKVAALGKPATVAPGTVGPCTMNGSMQLNAQGRELYRVTSDVRGTVTPPPTPVITPRPTVTPAASPKPTAPPTAAPTAAPGATPTPAPVPTLGPTLAPGATATAVPSMSAATSASPSDAPSASSSVPPTMGPTLAPLPAATPGVGGQATAAPEPTDASGGAVTTPAPTVPTFSQSVAAITDTGVNADAAAIGGSLLLALLLLLIVAFAGELFNNTVENNYTEISGWFGKGPFPALAAMGGWFSRRARIGLLGFLGLTALISSFVDPYFGLDLRSLAEFLGFLVGLVVVLASFKLPPMLARRRKTGELGRLRPLPWALAIAALFVLISRIGNIQPGYLYGIVLGAIFVKDVSDREEGRETFYGSMWTLAAAVLAWLGLGWVRSLGYAEDGFGVTLLSTAFAAILVAGLEAAAFGLMPLRFMPGHAVYRWNRVAWALLFGLSVFAFVHLLIGPSSGYVSELSPGAFMAALGVFAAFGALSIATWAYFRFRTKPDPTLEAPA